MIEENRHLLKPPVGNKVVWKDGDFIVMVVGGPNNRKDYHYNETPEFFHQIEGDIVLKVIEDGMPKDIHIKEGEIFLLPPKVPHSPQRGANTVGLVIEYPREKGVQDALLWFCENCTTKLWCHLKLINKATVLISARLAQSVERWTLNPTVVGSSPTLGAYFRIFLLFSHPYPQK